MNTSYSYDSLSRLLSVLHQASGATIDGASYTYDNAGNRTSKTNDLNGITENYTYDALYELTQVTQGGSTTESYSYDLVGNRLSSLGVPTYNYNSSNELTSSSQGSYTYDANGNTLSDAQGRSFTWDFENRLTQVVNPGVGTTTFKYDPFGRRIQKSGPGGTSDYLYDGDTSVDESDQSGTFVARYAEAPGIDQFLSELRSGVASYYHADGLGSITSLTNASGAAAATYTYDGFGNLSVATGTITNPYRYTSREFDSETALSFYRARYYDSQDGRFLSEDPLRFRSDVNFFPYVDNNPTLLIDPYGLYKCVGGAVCDFTPDMNQALEDLENCLGHQINITCGRNGHKPTDPHMRGLGADIGHNSNPWLTRDAIENCFYQAFPDTSYAQQEYNDTDPAKGYHYHIQLCSRSWRRRRLFAWYSRAWTLTPEKTRQWSKLRS